MSEALVSSGSAKETTKLIVGLIVAVVMAYLLIGVIGSVVISAAAQTAPDLLGPLGNAIKSLAGSLKMLVLIGGFVILLALLLGMTPLGRVIKGMME